ncbi:MAG: sigma-54-dependent Fis family transcriptional regulator [Betaproteobacteria bacterium]|nr:sigma-54-dependent Fis family transcriptional regulator [Betaproteobacteria bacterium]
MASLHVLVVDDEPAVRQILATIARRAGYPVSEAGGAAEAAAKLAQGDVDVALCDIKMPDGNGIDLVRNSRASGIDTAFIMVTAFGSMETAVEALRAGASDYIMKPVSGEEVLHRLTQIEAMRGLREENRVLRKAVSEQTARMYRFTSPGMLEIERLVGKVAPTDSTVLITGESGTGKGVVARAIHDQSARVNGPFFPVNCSAIPEPLLESEFFGHTKGAFTSADRARKGLFLQADGGTLFLDEIGELPLHVQTKLLHVIEDKEVRPVGSEQIRRVDTRIVAATNRDLQEMAAQGRFREDLYFRLGMFHIHIPPLRERQPDIRGLVHYLLREGGAGGRGPRVTEIDPEAEDLLVAHSWPGNVRELENVINRANILADGDRITVADLPQDITRVGGPQTASGTAFAVQGYPRDQLRRFEADVLRRTLDEAGGDRRLAAQKLGIGLSSLYRKLEEFERQGLIPAPASGADR